ncbi:MAG: hypothetical protein FJX94_08930 [Bacteroidetes bacterium]|nr:hypothetical protein [Bacteroidota bacterium]
MNRKWLRSYFYFSKKERRAVLLLLMLIIVFAVSPRIFPFIVKPKQIPVDTAFLQQMKTVKQHFSADKPFSAVAPEASSNDFDDKNNAIIRASVFDPNDVSETALLQMGLRPKLVRTLINYRSKGGKFRKPSDLARIYGMDEKTFASLAPYIHIKDAYSGQSVANKNGPTFNQHETAFKGNFSASLKIDINKADTTEWKRLPGIGSRLASRIVNFREKLGGFRSVTQVAETYALPDSTYRLILPMLAHSTTDMRTLNINAATLQELQQHPYISYPIAKAIVAYRAQQGAFSRVEDLQRIMLMNDSIYQKISPYLSVGSNK